MEGARRRPRDSTGVAVLEAGLGVLMQGSHELMRNISVGPKGPASLSCDFTQVAIAAVTIVLLLAAMALQDKAYVKDDLAPSRLARDGPSVRDIAQMLGGGARHRPTYLHDVLISAFDN